MRCVVGVERRRVVAQGDERGHADRDGVGPERERLGDVGTRADPAGDHELDAAMHPELLQRVDGEAHGRQRRDPDVLDEDVLRGGGPALHAVEHDHVRARLDRKRDVEVRARRADLDEDRLLPVGDLAQLLDLDLQVVGPRPVGMTAGAALVDARRQVAHLRDPIGDLLAEQDAAPAGLGALADHDLDRVRAPQVVGVHPVARGQQLVDERLRRRPLLGRHAAVAGRRATCPSRSPRGPAPPWPAPRARRSSCRRW